MYKYDTMNIIYLNVIIYLKYNISEIIYPK